MSLRARNTLARLVSPKCASNAVTASLQRSLRPLHREKGDRTWQFHTSSPPLWATFTKMLPDLCSPPQSFFSSRSPSLRMFLSGFFKNCLLLDYVISHLHFAEMFAVRNVVATTAGSNCIFVEISTSGLRSHLFYYMLDIHCNLMSKPYHGKLNFQSGRCA